MINIRKLDKETAIRLKEEYYKANPQCRRLGFAFQRGLIVDFVEKSLGFIGKTWILQEKPGEWILLAGPE